MQTNPILKPLLLFVLLSLAAPSEARTSPRDSLWKLMVSRCTPVAGSTPAVCDVRTPRTQEWTRLPRVDAHPAFDSLLTPERERELLERINARLRAYGKDTLLTSDLFHVLRPYFDWLHYEDPHFRIRPRVPTVGSPRKALRQNRRLPFDYLRIGDTLIVHRSLDPLFRKGDRILSINATPAAEYLSYYYDDRYGSPAELMLYYYMSHACADFRVRLEREGRTIEVATPGRPLNKTALQLLQAEATEKNIRTYPEARCGYLSIPQFFPFNSRLIRIVRRALLDFKKAGLTNVIIDMRRNPGGYGDRFDELLSVFIDKPVVQYCRAQRLKVSRQTLGDYEFLDESMLGAVVGLPDSVIVREFPTQPALFVGGMNYWVLVSKDTGSVAASFVNMMQYHGAAKIAGEPLRHNALRYGEVIEGRMLLPSLLCESGVSTTEFDEYTRAVEGVLLPDIPIPFIAAEHLSGRDAVLERLLGIIARQNPQP